MRFLHFLMRHGLKGTQIRDWRGDRLELHVELRKEDRTYQENVGLHHGPTGLPQQNTTLKIERRQDTCKTGGVKTRENEEKNYRTQVEV